MKSIKGHPGTGFLHLRRLNLRHLHLRQLHLRHLLAGAVLLVWAAGACTGLPASMTTAWAAPVSDIDIEDELRKLEDYGDEDYPDDEISDEEIEQLIDHYLNQTDATSQGADAISRKIEDAVLVMSQEPSGAIRYTLPNGGFFVSSVPTGMTSNGPVEMALSSGAMGLVQKDEELPALPETWRFTEEGIYHITMLFFQGGDGNRQDYNVYEVEHWFTITGAVERRLGAVTPPGDFYISSVRIGGQRQENYEKNCLFLEKDGLYEIEYTDLDTGKIRFNTTFRRDTVAPFLIFSKNIEEKTVTAPVEFSPSEPGCRVTMNYNGNIGYTNSTSLTAGGYYQLTVEDSAGNRRVYNLGIRQAYQLADIRIIIIAFLALAGMGIRLIILRRNMRVL